MVGEIRSLFFEVKNVSNVFKFSQICRRPDDYMNVLFYFIFKFKVMFLCWIIFLAALP